MQAAETLHNHETSKQVLLFVFYSRHLIFSSDSFLVVEVSERECKDVKRNKGRSIVTRQCRVQGANHSNAQIKQERQDNFRDNKDHKV